MSSPTPTLLVVAILTLLATKVQAQYPNGITFDSGIPAQQPSSPPAQPTDRNLVTTFIVNQNCACIPVGTCPVVTVPPFDVRIVNQIPSQQQIVCPANYVYCCGGTTAPPTSAPQMDGTCGIRKIPPQPQPVLGQASFGAYPWQAAILDTKLALKSSGVLLDPTHILTTAHRVVEFVNNVAGVLVRLGEWNVMSVTKPFNYVQAQVAKITIHPMFNPNTLENNVAVIRINGVVPVASYPNINTACRPAAAPPVGTRCYVSGWGKNLFGPTGSYQSIMREVDVPILDGTDCENRLKRTRLGAAFVLNRMSFICAGGEPGKDACTGDGGSPLVCPGPNNQWTVVGLVGWGIGCADPGIPGVYTNVVSFMPWITQTVMTA